MRRRWLILAAAALVAACTVEHSASNRTADSAGRYSANQEQQQVARGARRNIAAAAPALDEVVVTDAALPMSPPDASNMVIRTATASMEVDSLQPAIGQLKQLAARVGGYVANSNIETGNTRLKQAEIEVKIPATRFEEALSGLNPIGKLESVEVQAEDVGEEFVDVNARMDNARRLERRLIDLLATRTGKLKDVLDVEQSLAQVREEIERYQGRIRYLQAHTAVSTLTVTVHERVPVVGTAGKSVLGEAFAQAWRNLVAFVSILIQALGVVLPLGLIGGLVWFVSRKLKVGSPRTA